MPGGFTDTPHSWFGSPWGLVTSPWPSSSTFSRDTALSSRSAVENTRHSSPLSLQPIAPRWGRESPDHLRRSLIKSWHRTRETSWRKRSSKSETRLHQCVSLTFEKRSAELTDRSSAKTHWIAHLNYRLARSTPAIVRVRIPGCWRQGILCSIQWGFALDYSFWAGQVMNSLIGFCCLVHPSWCSYKLTNTDRSVQETSIALEKSWQSYWAVLFT